MRTVVLTDPGTLEVNWQWLPTWIGINHQLMKRLEQEITPLVIGKALTESDLDTINDKVIEVIVEECPLPGVRDYLDGLKFIET
jgi:hypothetical protein